MLAHILLLYWPRFKGIKRGKGRFRPIKPIDKIENKLFESMLNGENYVRGFTNKSLQKTIFKNNSGLDRKKKSNYISYRLRVFRAHGLIKKVPHSNLYRLTKKGKLTMSSALTLRNREINILKILA